MQPNDSYNVCSPLVDHRVHSSSVFKAMKRLETVDVSKRPSELIRYDFISAMKLPLRHVLMPNEYWVLQDKWKVAWDRGVHVPVSTLSTAKNLYKCFDNLVSFNSNNEPFVKCNDSCDRDRAWISCLYDTDAIDVSWLSLIEQSGVKYSKEDFERTIIAFEFTCAEQIRQKVSKCLTYDRNIKCEVCRSPDAFDGDEMVFCDGCDVCVHQSCYGISELPTGDWLCGPCSKGISKSTIHCVLCGLGGGALKPAFRTKYSNENMDATMQNWCHICCALWIPETTIGNLKKMEPIVGIDNIPHARWSLMCYICRIRQGACVQCSLPSCRKAFHVTCALKHDLKIETTNLSDIPNDHKKSNKETLFVAYCDEHSTFSQTKINDESHSKYQPSTPTKMTRHFFELIDIKEIAYSLQLDTELIKTNFLYWVDKRKQNNNEPLIDGFPTSKPSDCSQWIALHDYLGLKLDQHSAKRCIISLRRHLEVVRNLCYLVLKRERAKRQEIKIKESRYLFRRYEPVRPKDLYLLENQQSTDLKQAIQCSNETDDASRKFVKSDYWDWINEKDPIKPDKSIKSLGRELINVPPKKIKSKTPKKFK